MKKTIIALMALAGITVAADSYTWNGGATIDSVGWANRDNWLPTTGTTWTNNSSDENVGKTLTYWNDSSNGPGTTGSNMWGDIYVAGATGTVGNQDSFTLEGWSLDLHLTDGANLTFKRVMKFQGGTTIDIDATSSLSFYSYYGSNDGGAITLNNKGTFTLGYSKRTQGGDGFVMNLFDTGIANLLAENTGGTNTAKITSISAQLTSTAAGIQERILVNKGSGLDYDGTATTYSFTDANGNVMVAVDSLDALQTATRSSYYVTKDDAGIKVSYVTVPEPTTATLSLLALAGLAARRRRR